MVAASGQPHLALMVNGPHSPIVVKRLCDNLAPAHVGRGVTSRLHACNYLVRSQVLALPMIAGFAQEDGGHWIAAVARREFVRHACIRTPQILLPEHSRMMR